MPTIATFRLSSLLGLTGSNGSTFGGLRIAGLSAHVDKHLPVRHLHGVDLHPKLVVDGANAGDQAEMPPMPWTRDDWLLRVVLHSRFEPAREPFVGGDAAGERRGLVRTNDSHRLDR